MHPIAATLLFLLPPQTRPAAVPSDPVDELVQSTLAKAGAPGAAVAILRHGKVEKARGYGLANVELNVPATADTVFLLASVTKVFTATLVVSLAQDGKLGLDDAIGKHLEDLPPAWRPITVRQLLSHTSGLPDVVVDAAAGQWLGRTRDEAVRKAAALPMAAPPGTAWSYNQTNYLLLTLLVEALTGTDFDAALTARLLRPLDLRSLRYGDATELVPGRATMYTRIDWDGTTPRLAARVHPAWVVYPGYTHAAAGLNGTAVDLARFAAAVAEGKVLEPRWRDAMWTATTLADGKPFRMGGTLGVGLGWLVDDQPGRKTAGGTGGSAVAFRTVPAEHLTVVVLTNCMGMDPDALVDAILERLPASGRPPGR